MKPIMRIIVWAGLIFGNCLIATGGEQPAPNPEQRFLSAVNHYEQGNYHQAAELFQALATDGIRNGQLYYNLGNAYFRSGDLGRAIQWYQKARRLLPTDPDLAFNLDHAESLIKDQQPRADSILSTLFFWHDLLSPKMTLYLAAVASWLFFGGLFLKKYWRPAFPGWLLAGVATFLIVFAATAAFKFLAPKAFPRGVILPESVSVKSGLSDLSTELFVLHAGSCVRIEAVRKDYYQIRFGDDKIGWLRQGQVGLI